MIILPITTILVFFLQFLLKKNIFLQFSLEKYLWADSVKLQLEEKDVVQNVKDSMQVFNRGQHSFKSEKLEEAFHFVT